jgi:predicted DNA-binding protein
VTSIRLTRDQHEALKALARRENRTVAGQLRHVIEQMTVDSDREAV